MKELSELLNDEGHVVTTIAEPEPSPEPEPEPQPEPEAAALEAPQRDERGRFVPKGVDSAPPAQDQLPQDIYEPLKAVRGENKQLKTQLEALQQQLQQLQNPPEPPPSVFEDEQGWEQQLGQRVVSQAVVEAETRATMRMSEMLARQAHPDFDELKAEFLALAEQNPGLAEQAIKDPHPWEAAIRVAKNHKAMQELGATDVASLEAKLREKIMAELQPQPPAQPAPAQPVIPPTLSNERNVGTRSGPAWSGPTPLASLLG
jgi:hypothetical protein